MFSRSRGFLKRSKVFFANEPGIVAEEPGVVAELKEVVKQEPWVVTEEPLVVAEKSKGRTNESGVLMSPTSSFTTPSSLTCLDFSLTYERLESLCLFKELFLSKY